MKVGDQVYVVANGELNGRATPGGEVAGSRPYGDRFTVAALVDGWAQEQTSAPAQLAAAPSAALVDVKATGYLHGVDISSHQTGWTPDGTEAYVFVKATEGKSYTNPAYADQLAAARNAGLVVGHYHWLNNGDVQAQVDYFLSVADLQPGDMIACDWEDSSNPTTSQKDTWITTVQQRLAGQHRVGLYCNRDWWLNHDTSSFYGDYLWIANYTSADDPGIQAEWLFWQWTSTPIDQNRGRFADTAALRAWAGCPDTPVPPDPPDPSAGLWYSTDYLFPQITPNPTNPNGVKAGDTVKVTASGGLTARSLPGGPKSLDKNGKVIVRATGYQFQVTGDLVDGWVTGGTNWYSSDYLAKVTEPPPAGKPAWKSTPTIRLAMSSVPGSVSYLQGCVKVAAVHTDDGDWDECWVVAQDYDNAGNIRFLLFDKFGTYQGWFQVNGAGHGQTFYAYRSAAGNLYVWCGEDAAYRHKWASGKKVSKTSGDKMDYKGARPMGGYDDRVAFRDASDTKETFYLFDRTDFTDGTNRTKPMKTCTISKRTSYTQQSYLATETRIYRIYGSTDENCKGNPTKKHTFDVYDWSGKCLLGDFNITEMHQSSSTECEPEGIAGSASPGSILAGKREGPASASKRSYVIWELTGLP